MVVIKMKCQSQLNENVTVDPYAMTQEDMPCYVMYSLFKVDS